jgi:hypothetical protein
MIPAERGEGWDCHCVASLWTAFDTTLKRRTLLAQLLTDRLFDGLHWHETMDFFRQTVRLVQVQSHAN